MTSFITSAPGKVILFGEHAVVHNKPAIAAAVSLRTYTLVQAFKDSSKVELEFADIEFDHKWAIDELPWKEFDEMVKKDSLTTTTTTPPSTVHPELVDLLNRTCLKGIEKTFQHAAALAFIYLYMNICSRDTPGRMFRTRSTLPVGAGLGSSACLSVCLSAALLRLAGHVSNPTEDTSTGTAAASLDLINSWAFLGECCIHGNPSGIDNTVATRGGAVKFQRPNIMDSIDNFPPIQLVLTNTGFPRRTSELVANVGKLRDRLPTIINPVLDAIENVSEEAYKILNRDSGDADNNNSNITSQLGSLVHINHALLVALGVSHPALEQVKAAADSLGLGETKLTGAGGGGCAITLVTCSDSESVEKINQLKKKLPEDFQIFDVVLGGPGVGYSETLDEAAINEFSLMSNSRFQEEISWSYWV